MSPSNPGNVGTGHRCPVGCGHRPSEALLDVLAQRVVRSELGDLGPLGAPVGMPLRGGGPILEIAAVGRRVASEFPRDRGRRTTDPGSDIAHPATSCVEEGDLLPLDEGKVTTRKRSTTDCSHPTTLAEPPSADRLRQADSDGGLFARKSESDRFPELLDVLPAPARRSTGRAHGRTQHTITASTPFRFHRNSSLECCDDRLISPSTRPPAAALWEPCVS